MARFVKNADKPVSEWRLEWTQINHFEARCVAIHKTTGERRQITGAEPPRDPESRELWEEQQQLFDQDRNRKLHYRQTCKERADKLLADLRAKAKAEGRTVTFAELMRAGQFANIGAMPPAGKAPARKWDEAVDAGYVRLDTPPAPGSPRAEHIEHVRRTLAEGRAAEEAVREELEEMDRKRAALRAQAASEAVDPEPEDGPPEDWDGEAA